MFGSKKREAVKTSPDELSKETSKGAVLILLLPELVETGTSIFTNLKTVSDKYFDTEYGLLRVAFSSENIKEIYDLRETFKQHGGDFTISFLKNNNIDEATLQKSAEELDSDRTNRFFVIEFKYPKQVKILIPGRYGWVKLKKIRK